MSDWTGQYQHQFRIIYSEKGDCNIHRNSIQFQTIRRMNSESQIYWSQSKSFEALYILTLILLTWTIWRAPTNASKWRTGFNSAFKGLKKQRNIGKVFATHLNSGLCEADSHGDFFSHENIRIMSLGEATLQFVQLCWRKASPMSLLFRRFFRVGGRARRQTLLLLLLLYCLLWRKPRWRLTQWGSSQTTSVMVRITAVVQRGGFQLWMMTL